MKRIAVLASAAIMAICGASVPSCATGGSETSSQQVTAAKSTPSAAENELTVMRDYIMGKSTPENIAELDLNGDGECNIFDLCIMRRRVTEVTTQTNGGNILVACFSCTGNTQSIAEFAAKHLGADTYMIEPEIPYTEDDLKYYTDCRADLEQKDKSVRPAISGGVSNMPDYDVILLGYPIWHGQAPRIISTFLESYDLSGKVIVPFCTSGSSPIGSSATDLHELAPDSNWLEGRRFSGSASESDVAEWLESLGISAEKKEDGVMYITVGETRFTVDLENNSSAQALTELLKKGPLTIEMSDYGNFEKVGSIGTTLPRNDEQITTVPGDVILYQGTSITIYYDTNSWNFTRLGKIRDVTQSELKAVLGKGGITAVFSLE